MDYIFESYDQLSDHFTRQESEKDLMTLFSAGFNSSILWLTSENPYEIDRKLLIETIRNLHDKIKKENKFVLSMKAFSIIYDKNEKNEYIFDYFNKKGNFFEFFLVIL